MRNVLKFITWPAIAGLLAALLILNRIAGSPADGGGVFAGEPTSYAKAVRTASPSVVNIYTATLIPEATRRRLSDGFLNVPRSRTTTRQRVQQALGSGVIMTADGHILTNHHVIAGADAIQVALQDGRAAVAQVVGTDVDTDLAVLKVELPDLHPIVPADSDAARVGDVVLAIGNPLGFGHSVSQGIVSALGRFGLQASTYEDYIQTDASIHVGNSGGALVDTRGRLLGIATLIYTQPNRNSVPGTVSGIGLATPVNMALFVMHDLIAYGEVMRGWLGVRVAPAIGTQALMVESLSEGGPAQKAGVRLGDLITQIDGEDVVDGRLTRNRIALLRPGDSVAITVVRNQQTMVLPAIVGTERQSEANPQ